MNKQILFIFLICCAPCFAGIVPFEPTPSKPVTLSESIVEPSIKQEPFRTKSKYKTKARYFRRVEQRMLEQIRAYFIRQSWKELQDPELRRRTYPDIPELNN